MGLFIVPVLSVIAGALLCWKARPLAQFEHRHLTTVFRMPFLVVRNRLIGIGLAGYGAQRGFAAATAEGATRPSPCDPFAIALAWVLLVSGIILLLIVMSNFRSGRVRWEDAFKEPAPPPRQPPPGVKVVSQPDLQTRRPTATGNAFLGLGYVALIVLALLEITGVWCWFEAFA